MNWFRGEAVSQSKFINCISELNAIIPHDKANLVWRPNLAIDAVEQLFYQIDDLLQLIKDEDRYEIKELLTTIVPLIKNYKKRQLKRRLDIELAVFGLQNKFVPKGVIFHICAGNNIALPFLNLIDGLITSNINIIKLPHNDQMTALLIEKLLTIEPRLKPLIYCTDLSSKQIDHIVRLIALTDVISVWGSNQTIKQIRTYCPVKTTLVEWSNRIGIVYLDFYYSDWQTKIEAVVKEVVCTQQRYCSSPQIIFFDGASGGVEQLVQVIAEAFKKHVRTKQNLDKTLQAGRSMFYQTLRYQAALDDSTTIYKDDQNNWGIVCTKTENIDQLPGYSTLFIVQTTKETLYRELNKLRGDLQTAAVISNDKEIRRILYNMGITRIVDAGQMHLPHFGESHDGKYMLRQFVNIVTEKA